MKSTFRSLASFNYRVWALGALVSNIGTWMQRTAQDWLVLTQLTHNNATAVGIVMALQFGPQLLLLPLTGLAADHLPPRRLLIFTQAAMGVLALALGALTVTGVVQLWEVYLFALLLGCITAFDTPARQTFVAELVVESHLANAVALSSTSFNAARMIGPAIAGLIIAGVGTGWAFVINGLSFGAVLASFAFLRVHELRPRERAARTAGGALEGFRYVWRREDLRTVMVMLFLIGTFGINFPIFISTMTVTAFHAGASEYGFLTSVMAIGSVLGALMAARRENPTVKLIVAGAAGFGLSLLAAAVMPSTALFGVALVFVGASAQTLMTGTNSLMQLSTSPVMRGRVLAIFLAVALGGTPAGAPIIGRIADLFGPRWGIAAGAASSIAAAAIGVRYLYRVRTAG